MKDYLQINMDAWCLVNPSERKFWNEIFSENIGELENVKLWLKSCKENLIGTEHIIHFVFHDLELSGILSSQLLKKKLDFAYFTAFAKERVFNFQVPGQDKSKEDKVLHSKYNPSREALAFSKTGVPVLLGCGLGYALRNVLQNAKTPIILIETNPLLLLLLFLLSDYSEQIIERQLRIIYKLDEVNIWEQNKNLNNPNFHFLPHRGCIQAFGSPEYEKAKNKFWSSIEKKSVNQATLSKFEKIWANNIGRNVKTNFNFIPLSSLLKSVQTRSYKFAFLLGAGPNLMYENKLLLDFLKENLALRNEILLVCADTALKSLQSIGLDPDLIFIVDPQAINRYYLQGYKGKAIICTEALSDYYSIKFSNSSEEQGALSRLCFWNSSFSLFKLFSKENLGELAFGGSVTTNAFDFLLQSEIPNIFLLGQDLSFTAGLAHASGAAIEERIKTSVNRLVSFENYNYRQLSSLPKRQAKNFLGEVNSTNDKLLIFRDWFATRLKKEKNRMLRDIERNKKDQSVSENLKTKSFYVVGKEGLSIDGFTGISSKEGVELIKDESKLKKKVELSPFSGFTKFTEIEKVQNFNFDKVSESSELWNTIKTIKQTTGILEKAQKQSYNLQKLIKTDRLGKNATKINSLLENLETIDNELMSEKDLSSLLGMVIQNTIFQITEGFDSDEDNESSNGQAHIVEKSFKLYKALKDAAIYHSDLLKRMLV